MASEDTCESTAGCRGDQPAGEVTEGHKQHDLKSGTHIKTSNTDINPKLSGVKDHHVQIPGSAVKGVKMASKALKVIVNVALPADISKDAYRVCDAIVKDCKNSENKLPGKRTAKTVASVAGGWAGGCAGAMGGNVVGAAVGGAVGALFGGVGAVPGAAIGAVIGAAVGGMGGGATGRVAADKIVEELISDSKEKREENAEEEEEEDKDEVFGRVAAETGAAIGSLIGATVDSIAGGVDGGAAAESIVEKLISDSKEEKEEEYKDEVFGGVETVPGAVTVPLIGAAEGGHGGVDGSAAAAEKIVEGFVFGSKEKKEKKEEKQDRDNVFGGVEAVPRAAIVSLNGAAVDSIGGGVDGSAETESVMEKLICDSKEEEDEGEEFGGVGGSAWSCHCFHWCRRRRYCWWCGWKCCNRQHCEKACL
jgi:hypothetical protein